MLRRCLANDAFGYWLRELVGVAVVAALAVTAQAQEKKAVEIPLQRVVLFSSGVGFFQHDGKVQGDAETQLQFRVEDINDLLKSMVVADLGGGQITTIGYGSKDPISKTLSSFAIDLTKNPTMAELLGQIRGERVELEAPDKITGLIVGVEKKTRPTKDNQPIEIDVLNLMTDAGLRSIPLETVTRIQLLDAKLNAELQKALSLLASAHATDKKTVTLQFRGQGERPVRVGYIQEAPLWKTSYRLVLDAQKAPFLQGWAIVENTTESDWNNVDLTLVSGRPISFTMDLYEPLHLPRPQEQLELYASLRPQRYGQDLAAALNESTASLNSIESAAIPSAAPVAGKPAEKAEMAGRQYFARQSGSKSQTVTAVPASPAAWDVASRSTAALATAGEVGELFQYHLDMPVTLPRQQSAMLPVVHEDVKGEKVSIYNPRVQAKHPLCGLQLTNATKLHLMQGPITVYDDGVYAGDAILPDLPPGGQRLLSYALDLETEVAPEAQPQSGQVVSLQLSKGNAIVSHKQVQSVEYTVKNSGTKAKRVLIETPLRPGWTLVEPKTPSEKTRDLYRFAVEAKPGEPAKLALREEHIERQQIALSNLNQQMIEYYLSAPVISKPVKAALSEIVERQHALQELAAKRKGLEGQVGSIAEEQTRIRQNMDRLDRASDLYKRYVKKFSSQEDSLEQLRSQIVELQDKETELRKALDDYLIHLEIE